MTLHHLSLRKLHGYMNKEIDFRSDINLIVGINGSGKTSVLNAVSWLLQPSIPDLCTTQFDEIRLDFLQDTANASIRCLCRFRTARGATCASSSINKDNKGSRGNV